MLSFPKDLTIRAKCAQGLQGPKPQRETNALPETGQLCRLVSRTPLEYIMELPFNMLDLIEQF